jgi:hypothetical protein
MLRRFLITGVSALVLVACSSTAPLTEAKVAEDINLIANGFNNALSQPAVTAVIPAKVLPKIQAALADLMIVAAAVKADPASAMSKPTVAEVESDVNTIVGALAGLTLPPPAPTILAAATVLLPVIEASVGIVITGAPHSSMSATEARAHLASGA